MKLFILIGFLCLVLNYTFYGMSGFLILAFLSLLLAITGAWKKNDILCSFSIIAFFVMLLIMRVLRHQVCDFDFITSFALLCWVIHAELRKTKKLP
jgi:hypothetical protein